MSALALQVKKLQSILKPMMLRRLKDDVEKNLAPKQETIIEVELTNIQKKYYRAILEKNFSFLSKGANQHNMPNLINTMMELRKCCNHPYLINGEGCAQELGGGGHTAITATLTVLAQQNLPSWGASSGLVPSAGGVAVLCPVAFPGSLAPSKGCLLMGTSGSPEAHCVWGCSDIGPTSQPDVFCQELMVSPGEV